MTDLNPVHPLVPLAAEELTDALRSLYPGTDPRIAEPAPAGIRWPRWTPIPQPMQETPCAR